MSAPFRADVYQLGSLVEIRAGAVDPTTGGGVAAPINSIYYQTATNVVWQKLGAGATAWSPLLPPNFFGDGSDGVVVIGAGTTTLTRDMYYESLTVSAGATLACAGFRIFVEKVLTVEVGGVIHRNGNASVAAAGGAGLAPGTFGQAGTTSTAGGTSTNTNGGNGTSAGGALYPESLGTASVGGSGGASGSGTGGAGGAGGATAGTFGGLRQWSMCRGMLIGSSSISAFRTGTGGGAGAGNGAATGGGGGGGGGGVMIHARDVVNNGAIQAIGGGGFTPANANAGGGGGGGGGLVIITRHSFTGNLPDVSGGVHGNGNGTGANGVDGAAGTYIPIQL